ncbi:MAG: 3-oxoacyl-[acyl-carrier-protein] reductase [Acidobacteria bacterium]|nr:3-oxoacyl-[acyl-carrier-protein] reductase [Acidobacteriota bacterium]
MGKLEGKVAVVTGGASGIGEAIVRLLVGEGAQTIIADILDRPGGALAEELGPLAFFQHTDVSQESDVQESFRKAAEQFGKIDILVNNAGITRDGLLLRMKRSDWDAVININLTAAYLCIQQVLSGMVRRRYGRIINIASVVAQMGNAGQANYVASKAGIIGLTRAVAQEVASRNITVNAVAPGFIETAMTAALNPEAREKLAGRIPLGRLGQPLDVAQAVKFLASDEAAYITGHVLNVNGGLYL